ncbi:5-formyltetrahydrofolate cyclo-ligase [Anaerocolumna sp. AGMB13020]|uniref:5-formyltetrahydrofolate cyclo-ligase n=1 Tax=Anaerocolumna sp. AGMB13020 TaxID=3081750 RepID=UPI0029553BF4|nr:5-formyltetrahydrofolate cyclo-ligase [Anaerocolumna sp. AGMB13020]WOO36457.1 5-formyltetrahydrofolate cyclo-ligase [Anaerocolumna sp. AGMB13020]
MKKEEIRQEIREQKASLSKEVIDLQSSIIREQFLALREYKECSQLILYAAFNQEVNTLPLIRQALLDGKKVALPRVMKETIEFYYINSISDLEESAFGIPEPEPVDILQLEKNFNLILVPGLAFDKQGNRIGYGKSFYDRYFISHEESFLKICFAYGFQVYEEIPFEAHDVKIDILITKDGVLRI